ncbi:hypothetical protein GCM10028808_62080 [Spirosoma migulaei]
MAIDNCSYTFSEIAQNVLPSLMAKMGESMSNPTPINKLYGKGSGIKSLLKELKLHDDFQSCYVLIENKQPLYVGISRQVFRRLWYHSRGTTHYSATLDYRMATKGVTTKISRNVRMNDEEFKALFDKAKQRIQNCSFAFIQINNDLELYLFEAYCSIELDTWEWNTFRTH